MENKLIVSPSPHVHSGDSIEKNMYHVLIALIPAFLIALYVFRLDALLITLFSVIFCVGFEYLIMKYIMKRKPTVLDGSAIITGVLLAFNVPSNLPIWILAIGCLFAIGVVKLSFGGLGNNIFNPAIAGRIFLLISFPAQMTTWPSAMVRSTTDAVSSATVLSNIKYQPELLPALQDMFLGFEAGSLGEMSVVAILIGLIYLLWKRVITWHIPISILATVALFTGIIYIFNPIALYNPLIHLFSGGLMLGAVFMATDYVTSPMTKKGMIIFGCGIGVITVAIRLWGAYPEGVSFAILLMNAFTPLINNYTSPKRFGEVVKNG
ncbi:MAG TPA: RnfABCDGE type electron transport complex subunit D [Fermentimonas caenicola]|jgi:electron transport complex protein RnfD|uniref:Ion-translocating oxidoreductase complex subunit D n=1 Tax=Fermentimonas caenicola TaxID=1562970 RepID=A0A098C0L8_9BACT|nr:MULTISPECIES: RnfABCDGE type electron transport complex subunit D [Lascolabacillus]MBP6175661.1 RnfABCDGE type electron transport complex subunit D [Fermentimonas sp.]MDI9626864.1 RnfABCDGE type electron transport complex subunit D [Bacteroidota bacterium]TAH61362.1 MAG: RnfABCDGE type electron transport complex subunit D [Fermentimonas caenicola]MBP6197165.1 RnfABCDGE type electron transport complex subunit D [Fermentimonas sp.]MBP7104667.1 RnfABCDGE type electron transport complex subunit